MTNEMRKIFYEYFKHDIVGMNAKKLHLKLLREANFPYMDDRCINPRLDTIYRLHRFWLKEVAPKDSIEADPASEKEDGSSQLENIKKEDSCHEDFVNHMKETIIGLTSFDAEPSADIFDIESIKSEPVMDSAPKDNLSIKKERTESEDTVQDFICIANVSGNAIELANYRDQQRISCLNYMMNQYRPIMPKPVPGETNSKIEIPANNRIVSTPINPNILQSTKILHQKPILFSKHGVVKHKWREELSSVLWLEIVLVILAGAA
ncbi:uncharacterized protein LOC129226946 [Uloborus diversus]|uniref:uncharacterized protein LOC129226946 n=1 Tax=Uloborus diversus TaxID=327109 RepID=UPI002409431F|nr:uncharacterized protein LOC129226946 [Uloborus diversus]